MGACASLPSVTASPKKATVTQHDVEAMSQLYRHDEELLSLMCALTLMRDQMKHLSEFTAENFKSILKARKSTERCGVRLKELADRHVTTGMSALFSPKDCLPELQDVIDLEKDVGALGREMEEESAIAAQQVDEVRSRFGDVRDDVERVHSLKITGLIEKHEAAYSSHASNKAKRDKILSLPPEQQETDKNTKAINELETEIDSDAAKLEATTKLLKVRVREFLEHYSPIIKDALNAFIVAQYDAYQKLSGALVKHMNANHLESGQANKDPSMTPNDQISKLRSSSERFMSVSSSTKRRTDTALVEEYDVVSEPKTPDEDVGEDGVMVSETNAGSSSKA